LNGFTSTQRHSSRPAQQKMRKEKAKEKIRKGSNCNIISGVEELRRAWIIYGLANRCCIYICIANEGREERKKCRCGQKKGTPIYEPATHPIHPHTLGAHRGRYASTRIVYNNSERRHCQTVRPVEWSTGIGGWSGGGEESICPSSSFPWGPPPSSASPGQHPSCLGLRRRMVSTPWCPTRAIPARHRPSCGRAGR